MLGDFAWLAKDDARAVDGGLWPLDFMFALGLIIGGGTAQIQKNIIAERGLGMPREPRLAPGSGPASQSPSGGAQ
jgi:hypothetical protein